MHCHQQGALWDCPVFPTQLLIKNHSLPGAWAWRQGLCSLMGTQQLCPLRPGRVPWTPVFSQQVLPPELSQRVKPTSIPLILGCELSSSPRAQGGAGQLLDGHTFAWMAPPLAESGEKRRPGQPSLTVGSGAVCTMAWTPLLLVLLSHCTGRDRPRGPGAQFLSYCLPAPSPEKLPLVLPHH